jgi:two-component system chemotaxis response regulator CheY
MKRHVLAVDDSKTMRAMVQSALQSAGYEVILAKDGLEGLKKLDEAERVDAIITDVNMPNMDGIEFTRAVRKDARFPGLPILILTTEFSAERREQGRSAGATGWIVKPFDPPALVAALKRVTL